MEYWILATDQVSQSAQFSCPRYLLYAYWKLWKLPQFLLSIVSMCVIQAMLTQAMAESTKCKHTCFICNQHLNYTHSCQEPTFFFRRMLLARH